MMMLDMFVFAATPNRYTHMVERLLLLLTLTLTSTAALADVSSQEETPATNPYRRSDILIGVTVGFGAIHHVDHVLRANHSGWPFTSQVTPFTYSLAIYPIAGTAYFLDAGPLTWMVIEGSASVGMLLAHTLIEPPSHQYNPWAGGENLLGVDSPALGRASQAVSIGLSLSLAAHFVSSTLDGMRCGFTWRRTQCHDARKTPGSAGAWQLAPGSAGRPGATLHVTF